MAGYLRPAQLDEALRALAAGVADGRPPTIVAGATDHYPARVGRVVDEDVLDVSGLGELRAIERSGGAWRIPAGVTWSDLVEADLPPAFDGLKAAARAVGGLQIQNRATIVGNVCNASPAADGIPNLLALGATVELTSVRGPRFVPIDAFVLGNRRTVRQPDEIVTALEIPDLGPARSTFLKLGARAYLVISIAMIAIVVVDDGAGAITSARVAVGACSPVARRLPALEARLVGARLEPGVGGAIGAEDLAPLDPIDDVRATAAYRRSAVAVLVRRGLDALAAPGAPAAPKTSEDGAMGR